MLILVLGCYIVWMWAVLPMFQRVHAATIFRVKMCMIGFWVCMGSCFEEQWGLQRRVRIGGPPEPI
jgi:hypothetical protein